ncbi:MAG: ISNCY family transposase [Deltaproteobacteria bacterium]|nr:ISNCY family transposase [Deltaproteobacteria bacterium]
MAGKDILMVSQEERKRLHLIHKVIEGAIKQVEAAEVIHLSYRHTNRIVNKVRREGDKAIVHKSRGKPSNRRLPEKVKNKIVKLYRDKYKGFGATLFSEKIFEEHRIKISDETLRIWLIESGDIKKTRKGRAHRKWRERKNHFGEMVQMDGSHHDWFEGRGDKSVLMGYIDDAAGEAFGRFYEYEGTIPAMDSFKRYTLKYGLPMSIYLDKHSTYKSTGKPTIEDELNNTGPLSQFERAMKELGVKVIHANSPQAKGRIERLFKTLQDRLVKEMRLLNIKTIEEANKFLQEYLLRYNKRFAVKPQRDENLHREIPEDLNMDKILRIKTERALRNDFTVGHNKKLYQIEDKTRAKKVTVEEKIDGTMAITYKGASLRFKEITQRPERQKEAFPVSHPKRKYIPPMDHPWRRLNYSKHADRYKDINKKELREADT